MYTDSLSVFLSEQKSLQFWSILASSGVMSEFGGVQTWTDSAAIRWVA